MRPNRADPYDRDLPATPFCRWLRAGYLTCGALLVLRGIVLGCGARGLNRLDAAVTVHATVYCLLLAWGVGRIRRGAYGSAMAPVLAAAHVLAGMAGALALLVEDVGFVARAVWSRGWLGDLIDAAGVACFVAVMAGPVVGFLFVLTARRATPYLVATLFGTLWFLPILWM